jgi:hypothetical protein
MSKGWAERVERCRCGVHPRRAGVPSRKHKRALRVRPHCGASVCLLTYARLHCAHRIVAAPLKAVDARGGAGGRVGDRADGRCGQVRKKEMALVWKNSMWGIVSMFLWGGTPMLVTLVTFLVYTLSGKVPPRHRPRPRTIPAHASACRATAHPIPPPLNPARLVAAAMRARRGVAAGALNAAARQVHG